MATGDIIGFLHSDDTFGSTDIIQKITELFSQKNIQGVYGDLVFVHSENPDKIMRTWKSNRFDRKNIKYG